jgi:hypothetical protein
MPRITPDRAALEVAHRRLLSATPLDEMLKNETLKLVLEIVASRHMLRRARTDFKKLQANDWD